MSCNPYYNPYSYGYETPKYPCPPQPCPPQYPLICVGTGTTGSTGPQGPQGPQGPTGLIIGPFKSFIIDHPIKQDNYLVHACLEGPEAGVYYRGTTNIFDKFIEVELQDYVDSFSKNFTVHVTHNFDEDVDIEPKIYAATKIKNGKFKIYGPPGKVNWLVIGTRGNIEVEPKKSSVDVKGDGPYKYI